MQVLVLDTIHGGREIGAAYREAGYPADVVDVYRGTTPVELREAEHRVYDLIVAPVHLDPDHPLLTRRSVPVITHHEAVRQILGDQLPHPMIEITGALGKTTTAHALGHLLPGRGVLHTSAGTYLYPERYQIFKKSITPATEIAAARCARQVPGWLVSEISLGVTGAGDLAIITSPESYAFAGGKKSAIQEKIASINHVKRALVADGVLPDREDVIHVSDIARCHGMQCTVKAGEKTVVLENPLFLLPPYRTPLMLAAAAAVILQVSPAPLETFTALPGRLSFCRHNNLIIIDNANSGTNLTTTLCAARYARHCARAEDLTLVIGQVEGDGAVCEGFSPDTIAEAIDRIRPSCVVWVGKPPGPGTDLRVDAVCPTLEEGRKTAILLSEKGSIVLSVKTWR